MLEIEITDSNIIEGGVEVFARAWQDGVQIGFGKDGTVDIERFRIINPPVLVPDVNGDVERESYEFDDEQNITSTTIHKYREDPEEALLQDIEHTIGVIAKFGDENIIEGKVGNTTTTVRPFAGSGAGDPIDGRIFRDDGTWSATQGGAVGDFTNVTDDRLEASYRGGDYNIQRFFLSYDTSAVGSDTISSAVMTLTTNDGVGAPDDGTTYLSSAAPASTDDLAVGDYDSGGSTLFTASGVTPSGTTGVENDYTLNASGIAHINGSGDTSFMLRMGNDWDDVQPSGYNYFDLYSADNAGTTDDPVLVIEHSAAGYANKVNGVASANIGKVDGVATASISEVMGA